MPRSASLGAGNGDIEAMNAVSGCYRMIALLPCTSEVEKLLRCKA
jgi:hypothetical protein